MGVGSFRLPAATSKTGWQPQPDWIDISSVGFNEINLLTKQAVYLSFKVGIDSLPCTFQDAGDTVTRISHGYNNNDVIQFESILTTSNISEYTPYFVVNKTTNTFQVSLTSGGSAIDLSSDGMGWINGAGTFSVDWGDGTIQTGLVSGSLCMHTHTTGGTPCSLGYNTWKVRIYGASGTITRWSAQKTYLDLSIICQGLLKVVFGTTGITNYSNTFYCGNNNNNIMNSSLQSCVIPDLTNCYSVNSMFYNCFALESVTLPSSWGNVTDCSSMFYFCRALSSITLPSSWGNVTNAGQFLCYCSALQSVTLPSSWGNLAKINAMFMYSYSISYINLPSSWGSISSVENLFFGCFSLKNITLPSTWTANINSISSMFRNCYSLETITLPDSWGNIITASYAFYNCNSLKVVVLPSSSNPSMTDYSSVFYYCFALTTLTNVEYFGSTSVACRMELQGCTSIVSFTTNSLLGGFQLSGVNSGNKASLTSLRLTNSGSPYNSTSQINVSYTSLNAAALETLFGDIPNGLSSKTIIITGSTGCDTLISKSSSSTTLGSTTVTIASTTNLLAGMEVYGTGLSTTRTVTFQYVANTVTRTGHGLSNDMKVMVSTPIVTTSNIPVNTPLFVVNKTADTFQLSLTQGGAAIDMQTGDGTGIIVVIPKIVTVNSGNIVIDIPASATASITMTAGTLKRSIAMLKNWTVNN